MIERTKEEEERAGRKRRWESAGREDRNAEKCRIFCKFKILGEILKIAK